MSNRTNESFSPGRRDKEMILDFVRSARGSTFTTVAGIPSTSFTDLDEYLLGRVPGDAFQTELAKTRREWLAQRMAKRILDSCARLAIARLAFIEKPDAGPLGAITLLDTLLNLTGLEGCIIRPGKRLHVARVKGRTIQSGERLMIVSDVATTGTTILLAAQTIRQLGGIVVAAYVVYDRGQGAKDYLEKNGIQLVAEIDKELQASAETDLGIVG